MKIFKVYYQDMNKQAPSCIKVSAVSAKMAVKKALTLLNKKKIAWPGSAWTLSKKCSHCRQEIENSAIYLRAQ